jgi:hypothetical protein
LKDNFIHLINKNIIRECFYNINQLGICKLDIDNIINYSEVVKCDLERLGVCTKRYGLTRNEIIVETGIDSGKDLTAILKNLEFCGFIRAYTGHSYQ